MRLLETAVLAVVQNLVPSLQFLIVKRKVLPTQILLQIGMLVNSWNIQYKHVDIYWLIIR